MPEFSWQAVDPRGQAVRGIYSANSVTEVVLHLRKNKLSPVNVEEVNPKLKASILAPTGVRKKGSIKQVDLLGMTSELAIMTRAGLSLDNALKVLLEMSYKQSMHDMLVTLLESVKGGVPLSQALTKFHQYFGDFYINMIRSGEASGQMAGVLQRLSEHMIRQRTLRDNAVSAVTYPAILLAVAVLSLVAMLGFVVPQFEELFQDMGDALPLPTQWVMALGQAFREYGLVILIFFVLGGGALKRWLGTVAGRSTIQAWLLGLPVVGAVLHKYEVTLFSRSLGTLLGNGVSLLTALKIATDTVNNAVIRHQLEKMVPLVKEGQRLVVAARQADVFEPLALNLIRVGEETGRLGEMMLELSDILNRDVEIGLKRLLTMIEPALILVLGLLIAAIIVSILLGILSVNDLAV